MPWPAPSPILLDDTDAVMARSAFDELPEYSCSIPTGVTIGKQWKARRPASDTGWFLGSYEDEPDQATWPGQVRIMWRRLHVIEGKANG